MKASEAYFKGEFNEADFRWEGEDICTILVFNRKTKEAGHFKVKYSSEEGFVGIIEDTEMKKISIPPPNWWVRIPRAVR